MSITWSAFPMLDRLFDDVMSNGVGGTAFGTAATRAFTPSIDVRANDEELVFVCDVPGIAQEDLEVSVEADTLTIKGQRRYTGGEKDHVWLGRSYGAFERSFTLPDLLDPDAMSADLADGVLTIRIPKKPQARPRRVPISERTGPKQLAEKKDLAEKREVAETD